MPLSPAAPAFAHGPQPPQMGLLPLQGVTVLAVEDSRTACDALRLMCQRSGARMRRAETLAQARAHLSVYRPDVVIVDLGLPDGRGEELIRDLGGARPRPVVLALSGDPGGRIAALGAGADGFVEKPIALLGQFQACLLHHLALSEETGAEPAKAEPAPAPDPVAVQDDLARAEALIRAMTPAPLSPWLQGFVVSLARQTGDRALWNAAERGGTAAGAEVLRSVLQERLRVGRDVWQPS